MNEATKTTLFNVGAILGKLGVEERQEVAELGCGNNGLFIFSLARLVGKEGRVYAIDILKSSLEEIKKEATNRNMPQITTIWSNLEIFKATKIENGKIDRALLVNVLHQSDKRPEIIREAIRMLKRKGRLLIIEWKSEDLPLGPRPERRVKIEALKAAAPKLGLDLTEEFDAGPFHYGLIFIKL